MQCPACQTVLHLTERQGVEIDYCPQCRGVWLDRGELDKLIERAAVVSSTATSGPGRYSAYERDDDWAEREPARTQHRPQRRKSFLGELFDFD